MPVLATYTLPREVVTARNRRLRPVLAARWPGVKFRVTDGYWGSGRIQWVDGPSPHTVDRYLDTLSSEIDHIDRVWVERTVTCWLRAVGYLRLRDAGKLITVDSYFEWSRYRHDGYQLIDAETVSARDDARALAACSLAGLNPGAVLEPGRDLLPLPTLIEELGDALDASVLDLTP